MLLGMLALRLQQSSVTRWPIFLTSFTVEFEWSGNVNFVIAK